MPIIIDAPARTDVMDLFGKTATVYGNDVVVGQTAPAFTAMRDGWKPVEPLEESKGKVIVLISVPSLDTDTCDHETRRFNVEATGLSEDVVLYVVSTDFPFMQKRWCGAAGVERVHTVSDVLETEFGLAYGLLIRERHYLRRAVFIVDRAGVLQYVAYMPNLGVEPNYEEVIAAAKALL